MFDGTLSSSVKLSTELTSCLIISGELRLTPKFDSKTSGACVVVVEGSSSLNSDTGCDDVVINDVVVVVVEVVMVALVVVVGSIGERFIG